MTKKNFCIAPWVHLYVHTTGDVRTCCVGDSSIGNTKLHSLKEIWNSDKMLKMRKDFLEGKIPSNCRQCIDFEKNGIHSLRQAFHQLFEDEVESLSSQTLPDGRLTEFKLKYIDVRFSNFCNFKCRTCFYEYSSSIYNENNKLTGSNADIIVFPGKTKTDLFDQILPHVEFAKKIYFAGGEPLIQSQHWDILDRLIETNRLDIELYYNTNLSSLKYKDKSAIDYWKKFKNILISASIDGWKEAAEYWRSGTQWSTIENHVNEIRKSLPHVRFGTTTTVGWPNLWNALDLIDFCIDTNFIDPKYIMINVLEMPDVYSLKSLPNFKKEKAKERILITLKHLNNAELTDTLLYNNLTGLISFIDSSSTQNALRNFKNFNGRLDQIRNENFFKAFPEHNDMKPFIL